MRSTASFSFVNILAITSLASQAFSLKIEDVLSPSYVPNLYAELGLDLPSTSNPQDQYVLLNNPAVPSSDCLSYLSNNPLSDTDFSWKTFEAPNSHCLTLPVSGLSPSAIQALRGDVIGVANCLEHSRDPAYTDATAACWQLAKRASGDWCAPYSNRKCDKHHEWGTAGVYYCPLGKRAGMSCSLMGEFALWGARFCRRSEQTAVAVRMSSADFEGYTVVQNSEVQYS